MVVVSETHVFETSITTDTLWSQFYFERGTYSSSPLHMFFSLMCKRVLPISRIWGSSGVAVGKHPFFDLISGLHKAMCQSELMADRSQKGRNSFVLFWCGSSRSVPTATPGEPIYIRNEVYETQNYVSHSPLPNNFNDAEKTLTYSKHFSTYQTHSVVRAHN